ncbi:hypothetical protein FQN60_009173 [Etheostoma spectabile]|uniref:Integrase catalytic domain-containing protein n=1 Tax=Etheostoma spectabile TaxID=54343 RepID=A0A5J5C7G1_9PERO|nr:hypothetical protein FQN60_009173 [Etheostoma spectabile]
MKSKLIADETKKDVVLQRVIRLIKEEWPRGECQQYYNIRGELSFVNGLLLRKNRVVISQSLRPDMLKRLHEGHLGMENCKEFQDFAKEYDFCHVTSSPLYAQSNGKAEKGVHIVKQLLKKARESDSDPCLALLSYRASPLEHGLSPAEILMGRRLRTTLPYTSEQKQKEVKQKQRLLQKDKKQIMTSQQRA